MSEQLLLPDVNESFNAIVEAERLAAEETFAQSIDAIESSMSNEDEEKLGTVTMGKMSGCQDTGGGGHEWEKIES